MYGTQTRNKVMKILLRFENDVKMYGTQTGHGRFECTVKFENDVKMYGTQTIGQVKRDQICLRMM